MLLALRVLLSEWCVCVCVRFPQWFGAGMLVSGCRWAVLLEGAVEVVMLEGAAGVLV